MNLEIETAISSWLRSLPEFDGIAVHTGQSADEIPNDQPIVVVSCDSAESPVAKLYRATVQITLSTPVLLEEALETHRTLTAAIRTAANLSAVSTFFPPSLVFSGSHLTTWSESREDERLITTAELVVGIREI